MKLPSIFKRHIVIQFLLACKIMSKEQLTAFNKGSSAYLNLDDPEPRNTFIKNEFDPDFFSLAKKFLPEDGIYFDLGANYGLCSFGLLPQRSNAYFHIFEANSKLTDIIYKSCNLHPQTKFHINTACVSEEPGFSDFHLENSQSGQSHVATKGESAVKIPNLVLDDYCFDKRVERVDFAKIDLEGHELHALKGWKNHLASHLVKTIYLEIIPENQARYNLSTIAPLSYLESLGYDLFICKPEDIGKFGDPPKQFKNASDELILSKFKASVYPKNFATDVLAIVPK